MTDAAARLRSSVSRPSLRRVAAAPLRPRTYGNLLYLALSFPLGLAYVVFLAVGLSLSAGLAVLLVGVPLFVAVLLAAVVLVAVERRLVVGLLGTDLDPPGWRFRDHEGALDRTRALVLDPAVWLGALFLGTRLLVGTVAFVLLLTLLVPSLVLVATPLYYDVPGVRVGVFLPTEVSRELSLYVPWNELLVGVSFVVRLTSWQVTTLVEALAMSVLGLLALVLSLNVLNGLAGLCSGWARLTLGGTLADRLG